MRRPYDDYVIAGDGILVTVDVSLVTTHPLSQWDSPTGFPEGPLADNLLSHGLKLVWVEYSGWGVWSGGTLAFSVTPLIDFAHLADVGDSVAASVGVVGFWTGNQKAKFTAKLPDDATTEDQQRITDAARQIPRSESYSQTAGKVARDAVQAVSDGLDLSNPLASSGTTWILLVVVVAVVGLSVARK